MTLIQLQHITKVYRPSKQVEVTACDDVSVSIEEGEMVAVMGPSGAGKSTLLHIIGCIDTFDSGEYVLDGIQVQGANENKLAQLRSEKLGFVLQDFGLIVNQTVRDNLQIPAFFHKDISFGKIDSRIDDVLEKVHMTEYKKRRISQLSGGQKQRIAIARALMNEPKVLLCDEPTGALDRKTADDIMRLLQEINTRSKTAVVIVTHDPVVAECCDRTIYMVDGKITEKKG